MKKLCSKCGINPNRNETSSYCKSCHNEYQKKFYKNKPQSTKDSLKRRRAAIRALIIRSKEKPCVDCGKSYPYYVMDFDHVRGKKKFELSVAGRHFRALDSVQKEMDKCDVICSNCHRERTFNRACPVV